MNPLTLTNLNRHFVTLSLISLTLCAILVSMLQGATHAATGTTDDYQVASQVYVGIADSEPYCSGFEANITGNWRSIIADSSKWVNAANQAAFDASLTTAIENGSWSVTQQTEVSGNRLVDVAWYEDATAFVSWDGTGDVVYNAPTSHLLHQVRIYERRNASGSGGCAVAVTQTGYDTATDVASTDPDIGYPKRTNLLVGGDVTINYPSGYVGLPINRTAALSKVYRPNINYSVENYTLDASYGYNIPYHNASCVTLKWDLYRYDGDAMLQEDVQKTTLEPEHVNYQLKETGQYMLVLNYNIIAPCLGLPSPDTIGITSVLLDYDGNSITGSSANLDCDPDSGLCVAPATYEDCTTYGANIVEGVMCVERNFMVGLKSLFNFLFIPNPLRIKEQFTKLSETATTHLGFLSYPIVFLVDFFNAFNDTSNNWCNATTCSKNFGNLFGTPYTMNFYVVKDNMPLLWTTFLTFVRGSTVFALLMMMRRKYLSVVKQ